MGNRKSERLINDILLGNADESDWAVLSEIARADHELKDDIHDIEFLLNNIQPKPYMDEFDNSYYFGLRQIEYQYRSLQSRRRSIKTFINVLLISGSVCLVVLSIVAVLTKPYVYDVNHGHSQFSVESRRLPDNSTIALSQEASFSFMHHPFGRRLEIEGDARLHISVDSMRPFHLITDLGTIRTVGGDMFVEVVPRNFVRIYVLSGTIEIEDGKVARILHQGQNLICVPTGRVVKTTRRDEEYDFWYTGKMAFDRGRLDDVINRIENNYNVIIRAETVPVTDYNFSGTLQKIESIELILQTICSDLGLEYHQEDNSIYVLTRPAKV